VVRNVILPRGAGHISLPSIDELASEPHARGWIDSYRPGTEAPRIDEKAGVVQDRVLYAAEIWFHVKKHWCLELQNALE
jgi:hypothetical protein